MLKSLGFTITGEPQLHCASCEQRVTRTLRALDGVREVRADAASQRVEVLVDSARLDTDTIVKHLDLLGYHAQSDHAPAHVASFE
ncbi:MAG TPA: heavy-metal-associated domain-containing protein [Rhodanobacteraceae bacterium]